MQKAIVATIVVFCGILGAAWFLAERANPAMVEVDAAALHHPRP